MLAAQLYDFGDLRIESVPDLMPRPGEVVLDVACVQPSVTEAMLMAGADIALHNDLARRLSTGPVSFGGHEFSGVVHAVGSGVDGLESGDRVTAVETVLCGSCLPCRSRATGQCVRPEFLGFTRPGAFAEQVAVPGANVIRVPDGVSASAAAAVQPLAGAFHAHAAAHVLPGESVLVIGTGVMGLLAIQVARHGNAGTIIAAGRNPAKLDLSRRFGADVVLGREDDVVAGSFDATGGVGVDLVIETAGGPGDAGLAEDATMVVAARAVRRGGRIVVVSVLPGEARLPVTGLREEGVTLLHPKSGAGGYSASSGVFEHALHSIARGTIDVETMVTHRLDGLAGLPHALAVTRDKGAHGAINPAQVHTSHSWDPA